MVFSFVDILIMKNRIRHVLNLAFLYISSMSSKGLFKCLINIFSKEMIGTVITALPIIKAILNYLNKPLDDARVSLGISFVDILIMKNRIRHVLNLAFLYISSMSSVKRSVDTLLLLIRNSDVNAKSY
jgi:hypothetical protein